MEGSPTTIDLDAAMTEVVLWHYKHAVIRSWGGSHLLRYWEFFKPPLLTWHC
jgi:hypothetical protein